MVFWGVLKCFEKFSLFMCNPYGNLKVLMPSLTFWGVLKPFLCILTCYESFLKVMRRSLMFWGIVRRCQGFWVVLKFPESSQQFSDVLVCSEIFWGIWDILIGLELFRKFLIRSQIVIACSEAFWREHKGSELLRKLSEGSEIFSDVL